MADGPGTARRERGALIDVISTESLERALEEQGLAHRWDGRPPEGFRRLALDSRAAGPGDLFCAIAGARHDGHSHVAAAAAAGARAAVVARDVPGAGVPLLHVTDTRVAASRLALLFADEPARGLTLVGVTGTNGKTTTVWMLRHLLGARGPAGSVGTLGIVRPDGSREPGELTTPDPLELAAALRLLRDAGAGTVAMEVSSHALDQRRADALRFRAVAFTNLSREHLDYHPDMASYREAKARLASLLTPDGACVVNADEPAWEGLEISGEATRLRFGTVEDADVRALDVRHALGRSAWTLRTPAGETEVRLPLPGEFNVQNALAAAAAASVLGIGPRTIARRLASLPPVPGRMEILRREPCLVIRDYAHTPDSFARVLRSVRGAGRTLVVFGCGGDRDPGKRPEMGRIAGELADRVFVTTDNPRSEDPAEIARQVAVPIAADRLEIVLDREEAIARALEEARAGDVVLLLGKGHETYQIIGEEKLPFDERAIVAALAAGADGAAGGSS